MSKVEAQNAEYASHESSLGEEHREYLLRRHGTVDLDPLPNMDDANPLNWPTGKKILNLSLVSFQAFMGTFTAAAIQSAFVQIAADLGVSVQRTSYLTSLFIVILGAAPLLWRPLSHVYGRRPIFLLSLIGSLLGNMGCALSPTYATMGFCRALTAFFISPALSIGSAVVGETFFSKERGRCMGIWTIMITLGIPIAPLVTGFIAMRVGYRWIYWVLMITNGVNFIVYFFLGSETRYLPDEPKQAHRSLAQRYMGFGRIDPSPLTLMDFLHPLLLAKRVCVAIPAAAYAMIFLWGSVMTTLEIPQIFPEKFGFNPEQIGLQNIAIIIGTLVGEVVGGFSSDKWMLLRLRRNKAPLPEFRLWLSYIGYVLTICGIAMFFVELDHASNTWNVTPLVGAGIAAAGNQIVTTVLITYAVDCYHKDAAAIGVFIIFVRQTWGFIGPFWFPQMIENLGYNVSTAIATAMMVGVSVLPTMLLQWKGPKWR